MVTPRLPEDLSAVFRHVESVYPDEGCGVLLHHPGTGAWRVAPLPNVYDRYHARDPLRFPRTARTAYLIDPLEWLRLSERADDAGEQVACIFHSHGDVGAYFSAEDAVSAAPDGEPLMPGVTYLVVAVDLGKTTAAKAFIWTAGRFAEHAVSIG